MYQVMHAKILPRELRVKTLPWHRCYIVCLVLNSRASGSCTSATGDKKTFAATEQTFPEFNPWMEYFVKSSGCGVGCWPRGGRGWGDQTKDDLL
jgi:hypothetical protein